MACNINSIKNGVFQEHIGPLILTKIQIYILTSAELLYTLCYEIPCIRHKNYDRNSWRNHIITFGTFSHFWTILQVVELTSSHFWTILFSQTFSLTVSHFSTHSWEISEIVDEIQISDSSDSQAMVASQVSTGSIWKYK